MVRFGKATKTDSRVSVAGQNHDRSLREAAKQALKYPAVKFTGYQALSIGNGFADSVRKGRVTVWACAILPEHVHLVIARHFLKIELLVNQLKGSATKSLRNDNRHPFQDRQGEDGILPTCWARNCWKVFLDSPADIMRAIKYVESNPSKEGKKRQNWEFVVPYQLSSNG